VSAGLPIGSLVAVESSATRTAVIAFARKLYADQLRIWQRNKSDNARNKPAAPTLAECLAKSVQIRVKRERDSRYWNDLVSARPVH
jgi:hypothetical protein